jgi:hypothetical protein
MKNMKRMKKMIFLLISLLTIQWGFSQEYKTAIPSLRTILKVDGGTSGLGLSFETPVGSEFLIELETGLGGGYVVEKQKVEYLTHYEDPSLYGSFKSEFYFNRGRRYRNGNTLTQNSGNFIGVGVKYTSIGIIKNLQPNNVILTNLHIGIKRAFDKNWVFSGITGVGYAHNLDWKSNSDYQGGEVKITYLLEIKVSYILN